jgi:uncharacterized protein YhhL (DUF1145 family)
VPNPTLILVFKLVVLGAWFVGAAGFLFPETTGFGRLGRMLFWLLAAVHAFECAFFYRTLARSGRPIGYELLQTLLFGVVHYSEVKAIVAAKEAAEAGPGRR